MQRFSPLNQINATNVKDLRMAWSRDLGLTGSVQFSPVEYGGILYATGPDRVIALDATNGDLLWQYTTTLDKNTTGEKLTTSRGGVVVLEGKVYTTIGDGRVVALDATNGSEVWSTQVGKIQLADGFSSEPIFADGKIIVGPAGADTGGVPGRVVALDPSDGTVVWTFNIVPMPGEAGFDTWEPPSAAQWGGGSGWTPGAYDTESNTIIWGTGNPTPWYSTGIRSGDQLYTAGHIALDATTGKLKWYRQVVPNDEWDYDQHATPTIADLDLGNGTQRVAILPTTTGFVTVVDAASGDFIMAHNMFEAQTGQAGSVHKGYEADGTPIIDQTMRMPEPGLTVSWCPSRWVSFDAAAFSPDTGLYYRPNSLLCNNLTGELLPSDWQPGQSTVGDMIQALPDMFDRIGGISAIDPTTGKIVWENTYPYDEKSGAVATAGGLVFAAAPDRVFRAYDATTGDILWQQVLTAGMWSSPITYEVNGVQYVAVPAGGTGTDTNAHLSTVPPEVTGTGAMFVFALPNEAAAADAQGTK